MSPFTMAGYQRGKPSFYWMKEEVHDATVHRIVDP
jgi:hypothetical protein